MFNANGIIHLFSLLCFIGLILWNLKLIGQRDMLRSLIQSAEVRKRVLADWPLNYLEKLAQALGIEFKSTVDSAKKFRPVKIEHKKVAQLLLQAGLIEICCTIEGGQAVATLKVAKVLDEKILADLISMFDQQIHLKLELHAR